MCSIFGYLKLNINSEVDADFQNVCKKEMHHRGPDACKFVRYGEVGLGSHRLSIIDTREISNQPFESKKSRLVFNGEIYNYVELKNQYLSKEIFSTTSDTEVLHKGLDNVGVSFLNRVNGMFAVAWYQKKTGYFVLARDRFGVKPLHYMVQNDVLYFASEIKPLIMICKKVERNSKIYDSFFKDTATDYNRDTFVKNIFQVGRGEYLECKNGTIKIVKWYKGHNYKFNRNVFGNKQKTISKFEDLLTDAIKLRLRADVPVCMTLSGGLDSTVIYTLIKEKIGTKVKLFTFMNKNSPLNEVDAVKRITFEYGDMVTVVSTRAEDIVDKIKSSLISLEFPIWDMSSLVYADVYKQIRKEGYKVVIEGHGSDEQLGGYPYLLRYAVQELVLKGKFFEGYKVFMVYVNSDTSLVGHKFNMFLEYLSIVRETLFKGKRVVFQEEINDAFNYRILPIVLRAFDRLTMGQSVESRSPFMDYRVVEFLKLMPLKYKVSSIGSKAILREILKKYNKEYIYKNHKKIGFGLDYSKIFENLDVRKFFLDTIGIFDIEKYRELKNKALNELSKGKKTTLIMDNIWKISAVSFIDHLYKFK